MTNYAEQQTVLLDVTGAPIIDASGHLTLDNTVQSEVLVRLFAERGRDYRDRTLGSRLRTITTVDQAEREFLGMCEEALKPMLDDGRILRLEMGRLETTPSGFVGAELIVHVDEREHLRIQALPIKQG